jgi:O-antigen/teichoic acid export membrane protein
LLRERITKYLSFFGVDGAILYTSTARIIGGFAGIISILFVARYLSGVEQGFYYTFGSVLAIQVFFELGLNGIITQYVAHEAAHLTWVSETELNGPEIHLSRLSSLLRFTAKWYLLFAGFLFLLLLSAGFIFFSRYDTSGGSVEWIFPWILLSLTTTLAFLVNPVLAFLEGLGKVKQVARMRLIQQLTTTLTLWSCLILNTRLYAAGAGGYIGLLVIAILVFSGKYRKLLAFIWKKLTNERVIYRKEVFPYQWKIALSWISGYFIFQLFNPVLFATEGAVVAGQMGMTLAVLNGIFSLSFSWMSTKVPLYSGLIAQKKWTELDLIFNRTLKQSALINGLGLSAMVVIIYGLRYFNIPLGHRFLPWLPLILMMIPVFLNQFVSSWATYLRCHKQEPFLILSITSGIAITLSIVVFGKYFGLTGIATGYSILTFFSGFTWGYYIFKTKKTNWHEQKQR